MKKLLFVFGTRPEAIKMAPVIKVFKEHGDNFQTRITVTAQHRQMLDQVLRLFEIKPDYDLNLMTNNQSLSSLSAKIIVDLTKVLEKERPDLVLVHGDTISTLIGSLAAFYLKIPIAHIEAGLRTGNKYSPFPEEICRNLTSHLADINFAPTERAKENLINEGIPASRISITGNTVIDALLMVTEKHRSNAIQVKWRNYFRDKFSISFKSNTKTILVTGHRRENFGKGFEGICKALLSIASNHKNLQLVYPVHLNPKVQEPVYSTLGEIDNIHLIDPLDYEPFIYLLTKSHIILTDSGGIQEEAQSLGKPVLVMRNNTERPEGLEAGAAKLVGTDTDSIVTGIEDLLNDVVAYEHMARAINPYGDGTSAEQIHNLISVKYRQLLEI